MPLPATAVSESPSAPHEMLAPRLSDRWLSFFDRRRRWVILAILLLYTAGFNAQWRLEPDSALYLAIGRNLVEGQGYTFHGKDHRLAFPGVPLMFASLFKVFGSDSLLPHLVLMWLMGLASLALVYRLFLLHSGRPTAVLVMFGVAVSRTFYRYTFELLSDLPFVFGVLMFFVGYEALFYPRSFSTSAHSRSRAPTRWFDGILLVLGPSVAVSTRPTMWALVVAAALALAWSFFRGQPRWSHVTVLLLISLVVAAFYLKDPRHQQHDAATQPAGTAYSEEDQIFQLKTQKLVELAENAYRHLPQALNEAIVEATFGQRVVPGLNLVLSLLVLAASAALVVTRPLWAAWVLATLAIVLMVPKPLDRYFLPVVPITVYAWWTFVRWVERKLSGRWASAAFLVLFGIGGVNNLIATADFILEQRMTPFLQHYKKGRYASVNAVTTMVRDKTPPSEAPLDPQTSWIIVPTKFARILTFMTRRYCVEPERWSPLDPSRQNLYVLQPTAPLRPTPADDREPIDEWLAHRGARTASRPVATVVNRDPDDTRPFELYKVEPQRPASQP